MRLFVDCDDTLVLYRPESKGPHPYGLMYDDALYVWNQPLIDFIRAWVSENVGGLLVIWSGGGAQYAQRVAEQAGLGDVGAVYWTKDKDTFFMVGEDDIVVDDQKLAVPVTVTPPDFFDDKDNWGL